METIERSPQKTNGTEGSNVYNFTLIFARTKYYAKSSIHLSKPIFCHMMTMCTMGVKKRKNGTERKKLLSFIIIDDYNIILLFFFIISKNNNKNKKK